jgi:pimeloyl-ACP methyl ester carboxylesterase
MATDRTVAIRDGAVAFRVRSAGSGAPLVYFHSFHDPEPFPPLLGRLAARHAVHAPLHPGAGGSTGVETLDDLLDLTLAYDELLDALGVTSAALVGHFFGAMVAAEIAAVFPSRASRLVLISPLGLWRDDAPSADVATLPQDDLLRLLWADPASDAARKWAAEPASEDEAAAAQIESVQRRAAMSKFVWPIPDKGIAKRLHRVTAPTLVVWGDGDRVNPLPYADAWQRGIKGAALKTVRGGHMVLHESPDAIAPVVEEFLR